MEVSRLAALMIHMIVINAKKGNGYVEYIPKQLEPGDYQYALNALQMRWQLGTSIPCWQTTRWAGLGPQVVGGRYYCGYWRYEYTVLAIDGYRITVRQETPMDSNLGSPDQVGRIWTHCTDWDRLQDRVISQPGNE